MNHDADRSVDSRVLSLRALFDPQAAQGLSTTIALHLGEDRFSVRVADSDIQLARGDTERPNAALVTHPRTVAELIYCRRPLDDALRAGDITAEGKAAVVSRLLHLVRLPEPAVS
jgi:hypothetical protein